MCHVFFICFFHSFICWSLYAPCALKIGKNKILDSSRFLIYRNRNKFINQIRAPGGHIQITIMIDTQQQYIKLNIRSEISIIVMNKLFMTILRLIRRVHQFERRDENKQNILRRDILYATLWFCIISLFIILIVCNCQMKSITNYVYIILAFVWLPTL